MRNESSRFHCFSQSSSTCRNTNRVWRVWEARFGHLLFGEKLRSLYLTSCRCRTLRVRHWSKPQQYNRCRSVFHRYRRTKADQVPYSGTCISMIAIQTHPADEHGPCCPNLLSHLKQVSYSFFVPVFVRKCKNVAGLDTVPQSVRTGSQDDTLELSCTQYARSSNLLRPATHQHNE